MPNLGKFSKQLITDKKEVSSWKEKMRVINEDIEELTDNVPYVIVFFLPPLLLFDLQDLSLVDKSSLSLRESI